MEKRLSIDSQPGITFDKYSSENFKNFYEKDPMYSVIEAQRWLS